MSPTLVLVSHVLAREDVFWWSQPPRTFGAHAHSIRPRVGPQRRHRHRRAAVADPVARMVRRMERGRGSGRRGEATARLVSVEIVAA